MTTIECQNLFINNTYYYCYKRGTYIILYIKTQSNPIPLHIIVKTLINNRYVNIIFTHFEKRMYENNLIVCTIE